MSNPFMRFIDNLLINPLTTRLKDELSLEMAKLRENEVKSIIPQTKAFEVDPATYNSPTSARVKPKQEGPISIQALRDFSIHYPIARACIDHLKVGICQLNWDIVNEDEEKEADSKKSTEIKAFFKRPNNHDNFRVFIEQILEDYLVLGAISVEKAITRGGGLIGLLPVDTGTIKIRVNELGRLPDPPDVAYEQWINGVKQAELTTDEFIYAIKNARTNSPYGLSPLESLVIQVQSALAGSLYNYSFYTQSNVAEGLITVPSEWTTDQIKDFQTYFDALIAGDPNAQRKLKFVPDGLNYIQLKKPEDMQFERFELWLLQQTCAIFGVQPQDIGFTYDVNRATGEVQQDMGELRGKRPLVSFIEEVFTQIIQVDMGYEDLRFSFLDVDPSNLKEEAEIDDIRIKTGIISVDEVRAREGMKPIGLDNYVLNGAGVRLVKDILNPPEPMVMPNQPFSNNQVQGKPEAKPEEKPEEEAVEQKKIKEVRKWKKSAINSYQQGKPFKEFTAYYLEPEVVEDIEANLKYVSEREDINEIFNPYIDGRYDSIMRLKTLHEEIRKITNA